MSETSALRNFMNIHVLTGKLEVPVFAAESPIDQPRVRGTRPLSSLVGNYGSHQAYTLTADFAVNMKLILRFLKRRFPQLIEDGMSTNMGLGFVKISQKNLVMMLGPRWGSSGERANELYLFRDGVFSVPEITSFNEESGALGHFLLPDSCLQSGQNPLNNLPTLARNIEKMAEHQLPPHKLEIPAEI